MRGLGLWPLVTSHCLLCPQTDTSDPEKVVTTFLKVSSVFRDEATVRTAVQDVVGNVGGGACTALPLHCSRAQVTLTVPGPLHTRLIGELLASNPPALPFCRALAIEEAGCSLVFCRWGN